MSMSESELDYFKVLESETSKIVIDKYINREDIDKLDINGCTFLLASCIEMRKDIVKFLLEKGANPDFVNDCGESPLNEVISNVEDSPREAIEIASLLLDFGDDIALRAYMGKTPYLRACSRNSFEMIKFLVGRGCNTETCLIEYGEKLDGVWFANTFGLSNEIKSFIKNLSTHNKKFKQDNL